MNVLFMRCRSKKNPERSGFFLIFSKNLDSGACQVKNLKREKLSDFLGLTDIFSAKNVVTNEKTPHVQTRLPRRPAINHHTPMWLIPRAPSVI